jgi:hypothetical protein
MDAGGRCSLHSCRKRCNFQISLPGRKPRHNGDQPDSAKAGDNMWSVHLVIMIESGGHLLTVQSPKLIIGKNVSLEAVGFFGSRIS